MGIVKYKADSRIGRRLAAAGRSLTQDPNQSADEQVVTDRDMPALGTFVRAVDDEGVQVEGTVRHRYDNNDDGTKKRLGLSIIGRTDLVFVDAESAVAVTKKGLLF